MLAASAAILENDNDLIVPDVPLAQVEDSDFDDVAQQFITNRFVFKTFF